jgi:hypothetical protein
MADLASSTQRLQQFLELLPLTIEIAGLPHGEASRYFNEDQMELRMQAIRKAFRHARILAKEVSAEPPAAG